MNTVGCLVRNFSLGIAATWIYFYPAYAHAVSDTEPTSLKAVWNDPLHNYCSLPAPHLSQDPEAVVDLYNTVQSLPTFPAGVTSCPLDTGLALQIEFFHGDSSLQKVTVNITGCKIVSIENSDTGYETTDSLKRETLSAMGIDMDHLPHWREGSCKQ